MTDNSAIVAACRRAYAGFENNRREDLLALLSPDVVFDSRRRFRTAAPIAGSTSSKRFGQTCTRTTTTPQLRRPCRAGCRHPRDRAGDRAKNGRTMENEHCFLFEVKDGRIVYGRIYADTAKGRDVMEGMAQHPSRATG